ncbi:MAG: hypothetical protein B1H03_01680 [Planctomycetales bacterium 4484_113]|nr:MAG: hypothetical protein B1H03_01680 [Planctomycetales bacterium 4484_113]
MTGWCFVALVLQADPGKLISLTLITTLISAVFIAIIAVALGYVITRMRRALGEGRPEHSQYLLEQTRKELLELAQKKRVEQKRTAEIAQKLEQQKAQKETVRQAHEEARVSLAEHVQSAFGKSCPHCQVEMLPEDEIVICPTCLTAQHRVCFDLAGCINGCQPDYVYLHPADRIVELHTKTE